MYDFNLYSSEEGKNFPAWEEMVITDARRHPIEAGAMPSELGRWLSPHSGGDVESRNSRLVSLVSIHGKVLSQFSRWSVST